MFYILAAVVDQAPNQIVGTVTIIGVLTTLLIALLGWAYQLGKSDARLLRNEKDIEELKAIKKEEAIHIAEKLDLSFSKVYDKIDRLPCHNPNWKGC